MRRVTRVMAITALAILVLTTPVAATPSALTLPTFPTVVVVLAPYVTWDDIISGTTPALAELAADSAVTGAAVRAGALAAQPDSARGAAVLSAMRPVPASSTGPSLDWEYGDLGQAVRSAGGMTVAIGSSAQDLSSAEAPYTSEALTVAADRDGAVDVRETSVRLLKTDASAAGGIATDLDVFEDAYRRALGETAGASRRVIVLDPGDPARAREMTTRDAAWDVARGRAVATVDGVVRRAMRALPPDAALVVVSTAQYEPTGAAGTGPLLLYGAGPGTLYSRATRAETVGTLPDAGVTVLALLGLDPPAGATGTELRVIRDESTPGRHVERVAAADDTARALEQVRAPVWVATIAGAVLSLLAAIATVTGLARTVGPRMKAAIAYSCVVVCALPAATLVAQVLGAPDSSGEAWLRIAAASVVVLGFAVWRGRRGGPRAVMSALVAFTAVVIVGDQLLGGRAASGTAFSYSVLFGTRFFGLGNEGAAVLVGALLAWTGLRSPTYAVASASRHLITGIPAVVLAVLPFLGANAGVAAWGTGAFVVAWLYGRGRRPKLVVVLGAVALAVAVLAAAALLDSASGDPSHLGRLVSGQTDVASLLARKVALNIGILTTTPVVVLLPVALGGAIVLLVRPRGPVGALLVRERGLAAALAGAVAAAVLATVTEDSGVAVSAIVMMMPTCALAVSAMQGTERGADE